MNKPQRVRVTKMQETQIDAVSAIDAACKQQLHHKGVPDDAAPARGLAGLARLTKQHNVLVAEADGVVAGYAAWRDESPGVAYLEDLAVKPEMHRLGVGTHLLDEVCAQAAAVSLPVLIVRVWTALAPATAFLKKGGFVPLGSAPELVRERAEMWADEQRAAGGPGAGGAGLAKEGQAVMARSLL